MAEQGDEQQKFGPFRLIAKLAEGGMAVTWLARVLALDEPGREIALKRILPKMVDDDELRALFVEEARVATSLQHRNIVRTLDFGTVGTEHFLAMEYVWGQDLRKIAERGLSIGRFIPLPLAARIVAESARGLQYAHEKRDERGRPLGLVHRDVSPPNLMVSYDGIVKVVDFGIAKAESHWANVRQGQLKGKFSYMSPEQVQGLEVDKRSDIFALGTVLYEMTTVSRLFKGSSNVTTIKLISDADVPAPHERRPDYPPRLAEIVLRALAREPHDRYQSAGELADDLEAFLEETEAATGPRDLASYLRELFPDHLAELDALLGVDGYDGPDEPPEIPEIPAQGDVASDAPARTDEDAGAEAPATAARSAGAPPESLVTAEHELRADPDELPQSADRRAGAWMIAAVLAALLVVGLFAANQFRATGLGSGVAERAGSGFAPAVPIGAIDASVERPEPPPTVDFRVVTEPPGARIIVNGVPTNETTPAAVPLVEGALNTVALYLDGHAPLIENIDAIPGGGIASFSLEALPELAPVPPSPGDVADAGTPGDAPDEGDAEPALWPTARVLVETTSPAGPLPGAQVLVDGEVVPGSTPLELDVAADVEHHILVRLAGYRDSVTTVRPRRARHGDDVYTARLEMTADQGDSNRYTTMRIDVVPTTANVTVNGERHPARGLVNLPMPEHHIVRIEAEDYQPFVRAFASWPGVIELDRTLDRVERAPSRLSIAVDSETARIYLGSSDPQSVGATELGRGAVEEHEVPAGAYQLTVSDRTDAGRTRARFELVLRPGTHHVLEYRMVDGALLLVAAEEIAIDGAGVEDAAAD